MRARGTTQAAGGWGSDCLGQHSQHSVPKELGEHGNRHEGGGLEHAGVLQAAWVPSGLQPHEHVATEIVFLLCLLYVLSITFPTDIFKLFMAFLGFIFVTLLTFPGDKTDI